MDLEMGEYNEIAYRRAQNMLKTNNVVAVVQPILSNIREIAVKFLGDTEGRTICVEDDSVGSYGGIIRYVNSLIKQGKTSEDEAKKLGKIEYITFSQLVRQVKAGGELSGYDNILIADLNRCDENTWKNGLDELLAANNEARTLVLVQYSTIEPNPKDATFGRIKDHVASFISEEEATRLGVCGLICTEETESTENELRRKLKKIKQLEDTELKKQLMQKAIQIRALNKRIKSIYNAIRDEIDYDEDIYAERKNDRLTEEEFQQVVNRDLELLGLRNRVRELLREIGDALGEVREKSELESLKDKYYELVGRENEAERLLDEVEKSVLSGRNGNGDTER